MTDDDNSARTLPDPVQPPTSALPPDVPTVVQILGLAPGSDQAVLDRAARQVASDLGDDPGRLDQHRRNLARVARGDRVELARVLAGLLAGCRARRKGGKGGPAFASAYLAPPDATQIDQIIARAAADLRSLDHAAAAARAAIAERARQQEQQRADRREGERRRTELRQALEGLRLPADTSPAAIVDALAEAGLTLTAQRLPGLRPRLSIGDELGLGDLPPGFRDALERGREALATHLESPGSAT